LLSTQTATLEGVPDGRSFVPGEFDCLCFWRFHLKGLIDIIREQKPADCSDLLEKGVNALESEVEPK